MAKLVPVKLADGTEIWIESSDETEMSETAQTGETGEKPLTSKGAGMDAAVQRFKSIEDTIKAYTTHTLNAFKEITAANVSKVQLEFGIKIGGKAGIPFVTEGTAESNLKVTVECTFPEKEEK